MRKSLAYSYLIMSILILCFVSTSELAQAEAVTIDVWTNKGGRGVGNLNGGTYVIGEYIQICFNVNIDVDRLRFHIITPDGRDVSYYDRDLKAGTYCTSGYEMGPPGVQIVIVEAWIGGELVASDEVHYNVIGCPTHGLYIGIRISITSSILVYTYTLPISSSDAKSLITQTQPQRRVDTSERVIIEGWVRPTGIDWDTFKTQCYNIYPGRDYYHIDYIRDILIKPALNVKSLKEIARGIDDSRQIVWTRFETEFVELGYSDNQLKILRIRDSIKARDGYIDEVLVESYSEIWKVSPNPTSVTPTSVYWRNTKSTAPDQYEIYLYPIVTLRIKIDPVPDGKIVEVFIDGKKAGALSNTSPILEKRLLGLEHEVDLSPRVFELESSKIRYVCYNCPYKVVTEKSTDLAEVTLSFKKEYKVLLDIEPRITGLLIDGKLLNASTLPYIDWWLEGTEHVIRVESSEILEYDTGMERLIHQFKAWSDDEIQQERKIKINNPIELVGFFYPQIQYRVTISSKFGKVYGECSNMIGSTIWCNKGDFLLLNLDRETVYISDNTRALFLGWIVNGDPARSPILVDSAKYIEALWKIQYWIDVDGKYLQAFGTGWYDEGTTAHVGLQDKIIIKSEDVRLVFDRWEGDCTEVNCSLKDFDVTVNKPLSFKAVWYQEYRIKLETQPIHTSFKTNCLEWVRENESCSFDATLEITLAEDVKYRFARWEFKSDSETILTTSAISTTYIVNEPITIVAVYEPWYKVYVSGGPVTPFILSRETATCDVNINEAWCREMSELVLELPTTSVGFLVTQEFQRWRIETSESKEERSNTEIVLSVNSPVKVTAVWAYNYTGLLILIASIIVSSSLFYITMLKKKHFRFTIKKSEADEISERLRMLEKVYKEGKISEEAYRELKEEYEEEMRKLK